MPPVDLLEGRGRELRSPGAASVSSAARRLDVYLAPRASGWTPFCPLS